MAKYKVFKKSEGENLKNSFSEMLGRFSSDAIKGDQDNNNIFGIVDIITFCESEYFLGLKLYPWQKLILKIFYMGSEGNRNLSINDNENQCCENCIWNDNELREHDRCLNCSLINNDERAIKFENLKKSIYMDEKTLSRIESKEVISNFCNEKMLMEQDLRDDSDARAGGSVKEQVFRKIGKEFSELTLAIGRRSGKALWENTPILTTEGWKVMKDIHPGNYVFGRDGLPVKVIGETPIMNDRQCYEITFSTQEKIICDEQHEWLVVDKKRNEEIILTTKSLFDKLLSTKQESYQYEIRTSYPLRIDNNNLGNRFQALLDAMAKNGSVLDDCYVYNCDNSVSKSDFLFLIKSLGMKIVIIDGSRIIFKTKNNLFPEELDFSPFIVDEPSFIKIKNIKKLKNSVPVKCIEVHNFDNDYLCGEALLPTHNSMLVSIISLYESYKVIEMKNPQDFFSLNDGDIITILNVAVSEQQAKESVFDKIKPMITNSPYFKTKLSPGSLQNRSVKFLTERDKEINIQLQKEGLPMRDGTIYLLSGHSNSDSLVGKNILVVVIDEMASMVAKDGSKMSDEELYIKLKNSVWTFRDKAKILCISNPLTRDGTFYELYERSFTDDRLLMIQLPSYCVNPSLDKEALDAEKAAMEDPMHYLTQIEARFAGGAAEPFIPSNYIDYAFEFGENMCRKENGDPRLLYYMHLDPASNSDNYALAIVHIENDFFNLDDAGVPQKVVVVDHINMWTPTDSKSISVADVDSYVIKMAQRFNIVSITYDQWDSTASNQLLQRKGLPSRITPFNAGYKQSVYTTLRNLFFQRRIVIYRNDSVDINSGNYLHGFSVDTEEQLKFLRIKPNRRSFSVNATAGHHDDIPDCIAGAAHIALMGQRGHVSLPRSSVMRLSNFR